MGSILCDARCLMKRTCLTIAGSPPTDEARIELACSSDDGKLHLVAMQQDHANPSAHVYRGCVRTGTLLIPAAIKVQCGVGLSRDERPLVSANLETEQALHTRLQQEQESSGRLPLLPLFPLGPTPGP